MRIRFPHSVLRAGKFVRFGASFEEAEGIV